MGDTDGNSSDKDPFCDVDRGKICGRDQSLYAGGLLYRKREDSVKYRDCTEGARDS